MKLVFFGDSMTAGIYGGSYVDEVAKRLPGHEIINAGVGGNTVINLLRRVDDDVIDLEPDGVFVTIGGNDAISYAQPGTRPYYKKSMSIPDGVVTPDRYIEAYRDLLTRLHLAHIQVWMGLGPSEYNEEVVAMKQHYNTLATEVARTLNVPVLDLMLSFAPESLPERPPLDIGFIDLIGKRSASGWNDYETEKQKHGFTYTFDGLHLMPEAAARMAELIVDFLDLPGA
jgi:lysophospholipase L1-like esterase